MAALGHCVHVCKCVCFCVRAGGCLIVLCVINCCDSRNVCVTSAPWLESISCLFWVSLAGYHSNTLKYTHTHTNKCIHLNTLTHIYTAQTRQLASTLLCLCPSNMCLRASLLCVYVCVCHFLQHLYKKVDIIWMNQLVNKFQNYIIIFHLTSK